MQGTRRGVHSWPTDIVGQRTKEVMIGTRCVSPSRLVSDTCNVRHGRIDSILPARWVLLAYKAATQLMWLCMFADWAVFADLVGGGLEGAAEPYSREFE